MKNSRFAWVVATLLFFATTINYMDRQVIGLLKPILEKEFNWSNTDYSIIITFFQAAYALGLLFVGRFIDKVGTRIGYAVSILIWGISSLAHALATGKIGFTAARSGLGFGESGNFPAAIKATAEWFPKKDRAFATGFFNSGANIGSLIAPLIIPWIIIIFTSNPTKPFWQAAFIFTGLLDLIWLVIWWRMYKIPEKKGLTKEQLAYINQDDENITSEKISWRKLWSYKQTWAYSLAKFMTDCVWWFYLFFLPSLLNDKFHLDIRKLGLPLVAVYAITTVGSLGGGWLSSYFIRIGWSINRARKTALFIFAIFVIPVILVKYVSLWPAVILIGIAAAAHQAWSANIMTTVSDMFPKNAVSSVIGLGGMFGSVGSMLFTLVTGFLLDHFKIIGNIETGYSILFVYASSVYVFAWLIFHFLAPKMKLVSID